MNIDNNFIWVAASTELVMDLDITEEATMEEDMEEDMSTITITEEY